MKLFNFNFKSTSLIIFLLIISSSLYSQRQYSISAGSDYSVSTNSSNKGKFGFHFSGDVQFSLNKHFSIKTGVGIKQLSFSISSRTSEMIYFTGINGQIIYNDGQPFIIPNSVIETDSGYVENTEPILFDSLHNYWGNDFNELTNSYPSKYMTVMFNVPIQLQVNLFKNKLLLTTGTSISTIIYAKNILETKGIDPEAIDINADNDSYTANSDFNTVFANVNIGAEYKIFKNFYAGLFYERSITNPLKYSSLYLNNFSLNISYKLYK